jgi:hypothetical protein
MASNIAKKKACNKGNYLMIFVFIRAFKGLQVVLQGISKRVANTWMGSNFEIQIPNNYHKSSLFMLSHARM